MNKKLPLGLLAAALMVLPACSGGDAPVETVTETTTVESPDKPNPTRGGSPADEKPDSASKTTTTGARHTGYTGAPTGDPTPIDKSIARCAKSSEGLYEQGTTWFTDGTSGWTQYCSDNFHDGPPHAYEPYTPPAQNTPSPWVQGQIDWSNCLESGKSEEQCRAELN